VTTALATKSEQSAVIERVITVGDLSKLSAPERVSYYNAVCSSVGLNPLTRPFEFITLNNKLTLYARKDATDQLRKINQVSIQIVSRERLDDAYVVTARATDAQGRTDESIGAVSIGNLKGDALCNALMKAETKAKRRVTLSIVGLGWLDESEIETIPQAAPVAVSTEGVIVESQRVIEPSENADEVNWTQEIAHYWKKLKAIGHGAFQSKEDMLSHFKSWALVKGMAERLQEIDGLNGVPELVAQQYASHLVDIYEATKEAI